MNAATPKTTVTLYKPKSSVAQSLNRLFFVKKTYRSCDYSMFKTHDTQNEDNGYTEKITVKR